MSKEVRFELPRGETLHQSRCQACNAGIFWMLTKNDKRMPLDAASSRKEDDGRVTYVSHFAMCPQASQFRRNP